MKSPQRKKHTARNVTIFFISLIVITVIITIIGTSSSSTSSTHTATRNASQSSSTAVQAIPYQIVWEHQIPNGGYTRYIVVSSAHRNVTDLKALGQTLIKDTSGDRNAFVFVFDDPKAAQLMPIQDLSNEDEAFLERHEIAIYTRNINTGLNELQVMLEGSIQKVDY